MAGPILVPALVALRNEFNRVNPARDKRSDGWLGDRAHALTPSDHNPDETGRTPYTDADNVDEVHGLDVDHTGPWPTPTWFWDQVQHIVLQHRRGRDDRLQNVIYRGLIASRSWGWDWRTYAGRNGHYGHAHFSCRYTTAQELDQSQWLEDWMLNPDDKVWLTNLVRTEVSKVVTLDADPTDRTYSLGGLVTTLELRSRDDDARADKLQATVDAQGEQLRRLEVMVGRLLGSGPDDPAEPAG